jgi:hypothetical protein
MNQNFFSKSFYQLLQIKFWNVYGRNSLGKDKMYGCRILDGGSSSFNTAIRDVDSDQT